MSDRAATGCLLFAFIGAIGTGFVAGGLSGNGLVAVGWFLMAIPVWSVVLASCMKNNPEVD